MRGLSVATVAALASTVAADLPSIVIKGSKFFYSNNGTQFFMKGVAYQQQYTGGGSTGNGTSDNTAYTDPLSNEDNCKRDIPYLQQLQTNIIRVYAIDPTQDHDACMSAMSDAGIYVVADLSAPTTDGSINRDSPAWNDALYARYTAVVDTMIKYNNTLGFFAGNEVSNAPNNTNAAAFVKAAARDTKAYIKSKNYREVGVGYATSDDQFIRENIGTYMNCGDAADAIDFLGYNIYSWCGQSSYETSGYKDRTEEFSSYSVPVFFAEYGCIDPMPRTFDDVQALYGSDMTPVWSGGIVYMYFEEDNNYGLVNVDGNTVTPKQDFDNLSSQIAKISPSATQSDSYTPSNSPAACPTVNANWSSEATPLPPTPNQELCSCMYNSLSCVVSPGVDNSTYGELFGYVCQQDGVCDGIAHNSTTGKYGAYGMCNATEQLAYVFNAYYSKNGASSSACAFSGSATLQSAVTPTGQCASLVSQAGTNGAGTVAQPSGSSGSGSAGSASGSTSKGAAGFVGAPSVDAGLLPMMVMATVGLVSGVGMILL